jgi:hypothetical protein
MIDSEGRNELIQLDPNIKLLDVINFIWIPLHPEPNSSRKELQITMIYSRNRKK